uniref:Squamosa promoter binding protein-like 7 n=1 Tax=Tetraselmis sp. GSL018 TaxID=582737 RepID=A0A061RIA8_9CHLO|mmetsp:Transcript_844/g.2033  ORF Transcript_844/g.2033 Transcript_844/m.2033 type:complete len:301 (-) Transcript_844:259-1161(-)
MADPLELQFLLQLLQEGHGESTHKLSEDGMSTPSNNTAFTNELEEVMLGELQCDATCFNTHDSLAHQYQHWNSTAFQPEGFEAMLFDGSQAFTWTHNMGPLQYSNCYDKQMTSEMSASNELLPSLLGSGLNPAHRNIKPWTGEGKVFEESPEPLFSNVYQNQAHQNFCFSQHKANSNSLSTNLCREPISRVRLASETRLTSRRPVSISVATEEFFVCQICSETVETKTVRKYIRNRRVCNPCRTSSSVVIEGKDMRFCQLCSWFHSLDAFDGKRHNCRVALEKHNNRRRAKSAKLLVPDK